MEKEFRTKQIKFVQYAVSPRTGEEICDLFTIARKIERYKTFKKWTWYIHDHDVVTADTLDDMTKILEKEAKSKGIKGEDAIQEYINANAWYTDEDMKNKTIRPPHIHGSIQSTRAFTFEEWGNMLGVPAFLIEKLYGNSRNGHDAVLDMVEYGTHEGADEQAAGKTLYLDSVIHVSESLANWREMLNERNANIMRYGSECLSPLQMAVHDVLHNGKTLHECYMQLGAEDYTKNLARLRQARDEYLRKGAVLPNTRLTFYVCGDGGEGKDEYCKLLARALCPDIPSDTPFTYVAYTYGGHSAEWQNYDGQPVVIYQDMRAVEFVMGGRRETLSAALNAHPGDGDDPELNKKYGSVRLIHRYNIINGIEPFDDFIQGLAGGYTDKQGFEHIAETANLEQYRRRIPIIIPISGDNFRILVNKGVFEGTREYDTYLTLANMVGNFGRLRRMCGAKGLIMQEIAAPLVDSTVQVADKMLAAVDKDNLSDDEVRANALQYMQDNDYGEMYNGITGELTPKSESEFVEFMAEVTRSYNDYHYEGLMMLGQITRESWFNLGRPQHIKINKQSISLTRKNKTVKSLSIDGKRLY